MGSGARVGASPCASAPGPKDERRAFVPEPGALPAVCTRRRWHHDTMCAVCDESGTWTLSRVTDRGTLLVHTVTGRRPRAHVEREACPYCGRMIVPRHMYAYRKRPHRHKCPHGKWCVAGQPLYWVTYNEHRCQKCIDAYPDERGPCNDDPFSKP